VNQPYPVPYGVPALRGASFGGAMPFGLELGIGTNFDIGGDFLTPKEGGIVTNSNGNTVAGGPSLSDQKGVSYKDAFKQSANYDAAMTYDLDRNTTILGRFGYNKADGQSNKVGTINDGNGGADEDLYVAFSDLEQVTLEGGLRRYMGGWGHGGGFRPYVGATAGFTHTDKVIGTYASDTVYAPGNYQPVEYASGGWTPTASGIVGAEMAVGNRAAIAVESGIRWSDDLNTISPSEDRWSVPVQLRGRVSF